MGEVKQMELFRKPKGNPRPRRDAASMEMRGPAETFRKEVINETKGPHMCEMCRQIMLKGSRAVRIITIENGQANYDKITYFHFKKDCPEFQNF